MSLKKQFFEFIKFSSHKRGFTLIELLITVSIIAVLSTIGFSIYNTTQVIARDTKRKEDLKNIAAAMEVYHQYIHSYPIASDNSSSGTWSNLLSSNYIESMPVDPLNTGTSIYHYSSDGITLDLCALLENNQEALGGNIIVGGPAPCGGLATQHFFHIAGP